MKHESAVQAVKELMRKDCNTGLGRCDAAYRPLYVLYGGQYLYSIIQADGLGIRQRIHYGYFRVEQKQSWQGWHQLFDDLRI